MVDRKSCPSPHSKWSQPGIFDPPARPSGVPIVGPRWFMSAHSRNWATCRKCAATGAWNAVISKLARRTRGLASDTLRVGREFNTRNSCIAEFQCGYACCLDEGQARDPPGRLGRPHAGPLVAIPDIGWVPRIHTRPQEPRGKAQPRSFGPRQGCAHSGAAIDRPDAHRTESRRAPSRLGGGMPSLGYPARRRRDGPSGEYWIALGHLWPPQRPGGIFWPHCAGHKLPSTHGTVLAWSSRPMWPSHSRPKGCRRACERAAGHAAARTDAKTENKETPSVATCRRSIGSRQLLPLRPTIQSAATAMGCV